MISWYARPADFNPRSHKGSDEEIKTPVVLSADFNPRSHKGSDQENPSIRSGSLISIHAPTRGATIYHRDVTGNLNISIHAPTRGATDQGITNTDLDTNFNPRSHKGSDSVDDFSHTLIGISIHAPTRGATPSGGSGSKNRFKFQSTLPQGERQR